MYTIVDVETGEIYTKEQIKSLILKTIKYEHSAANVFRPDGTKFKRHTTIRIVQVVGKQETINFFNEEN